MPLSALLRLRVAVRRLFGYRHRESMDRRLADEMRFHLDMATQQGVHAGIAPDEARRQALVAFGGRDRWEESARDSYRSRPLEEFGRDVRYALRGLRGAPAFTIAAVATLALSIGAATSVFSVVSAVLLRDLPYPAPERIAVLCERNLSASNPCNSINPANFLSWQDEAKSFSAIASMVEATASITGGGAEPVSARARIANASLFPILGARAAAGRFFTVDEDRAGGPDLVVLSHGFWRQHFGGDASIVGKTILVNAYAYTVVGIAAPSFQLFEPVDLWLPMRFTAQHRDARGRYLRAIARLRDGATMEQANREMVEMAARRAVTVPALDANWTALAMPLSDNVVGSSRLALWILLGAVAFLLLIACANVANLLLARAADRQREMAVRISLGAAPARIVRQLLTESLVLSLVSSVIGFVIAVKGTRTLVALVPQGLSTQSLASVGVDWRVLVFTTVVAVLTGVMFGLAPASQVRRTNVQEAIQEGGRSGMGGTRSSARLRGALVIAEVSLAIILLTGAGLMVRSFSALQRVRLGFEPANALTARLTLPGRRYPSDTSQLAFYNAAEARLSSLPGVKAVGFISFLPLSGARAASSFNVEGRPPAPPGQEPTGDMRAVSPGYFKAMGITLKEGRDITKQDVGNTPAVAVVSETLASTFWPGESAVGHFLLYEWQGNERVEIVGVAADVHHDGPDKSAFMEIYRPLAQFPYDRMNLVARVAGTPMNYAAVVHDAISAIDPELPLAQVKPMSDLVRESLGASRLSTTLFGLFGALGLILAAVGIYGLMAYTVQQRRHEIGIRMTLGARPGQVVRMVIGRGVVLAFSGILIGMIGAFALTRFMRALLFQVAPGDLGTFVVVAVVLSAVAVTASYFPGRRATHVDPVTVLRGD